MSKKRNKKYTPRRASPGALNLLLLSGATDRMSHKDQVYTELSWRLHYSILSKTHDRSSHYVLTWMTQVAIELGVNLKNEALANIGRLAFKEIHGEYKQGDLKMTRLCMNALISSLGAVSGKLIDVCNFAVRQRINSASMIALKQTPWGLGFIEQIIKGASIKSIATELKEEPKNVQHNFFAVAYLLHKLHGDMSVPDPIKLGDVRRHKAIYLQAIDQARLVTGHG